MFIQNHHGIDLEAVYIYLFGYIYIYLNITYVKQYCKKKSCDSCGHQDTDYLPTLIVLVFE